MAANANVPAADHDDMKDFEDEQPLGSSTAIFLFGFICMCMHVDMFEFYICPRLLSLREILSTSKVVQLLKDILTLLATDGEGVEDGASDASSDSGAEDSAGEESGGDEAAAEGSDMDTCETQVPMQSSAEESSTKSKILPPVPKFIGGADAPNSSLAPGPDEIAVKSEAPDSSMAPNPEIPVKSQAPECDNPVKSQAPECDNPGKFQAPECDNPVKSEAPECDNPVKSEAPAAAVPPQVPDKQCPNSANPESPEPNLPGTKSPTFDAARLNRM
eukprot:s665_g2.t1